MAEDVGVKLTLEVRNVDAVRGALHDVRGGFAKYVSDVALLLEGEARRGAKPHSVDTGELARSIVSDLGPLPTELRARVYSDHPAAVPMEFGRRPGSAFPPAQPIADWLRRHGLDDIPVFVMQRAIAIKGTKPLRMFATAVERVQANLSATIRDVEAYIVGRWP